MDPNNSPSAAEDSDCTFSYDTPGTVSLTVEVIDSVLYSSTSNALDITIASVATPIAGKYQVTTTSSKINTLTVTWPENAADTYTCSINKTSETVVAASSGNSCSAAISSTIKSVPVEIDDNISTNQTPYTATVSM
jgi:hypothetical protein